METLNLTHGLHKSPEDGMCLMEAVAFLAGEKHSDHPDCACPVLSAYGRALNDRMGEGVEGDALRAKYLAPLAEKLVGTRSTPEVERRRAFFFADRAVRVFVPMALDSAGLGSEAARLRGLPEIVDKKTARDAASASEAAWEACEAAWEAADPRSPRDVDAADAAGCVADAAAHAADWAWAAASAEASAFAAWAAWAAADAAASAAGAWEQAVKVLAEACEIKG